MEKDINSSFNSWHENQSIDESADTPWYNFVKEILKGRNLKGNKILEIGCGRGDFTFWFNNQYHGSLYQFVAADFSESAIRMAKERSISLGFKNILYTVQDIQKMKFEGEEFDIVISCETIEHVPKPKAALRELYRVCAKNGLLILTTPNYLGFFGLYRIFLRLTGRKWTEVGQPINNFMLLPKTLMMVKNSGFKILCFDSEIISTPYFGKRVRHFNWKKPRWFLDGLAFNLSS